MEKKYYYVNSSNKHVASPNWTPNIFTCNIHPFERLKKFRDDFKDYEIIVHGWQEITADEYYLHKELGL